jgi:translation initiation factor eIF-2B subunit delta
VVIVEPQSRLSGSELFFEIAGRLIESAAAGVEKAFVEKLIDLYNYIVHDRPPSIAPLNLLRFVAQRLLNEGFTGIDKYVSSLASEYDRALWRSAEVAARRVLDGEVIMTTSNSLAVRRFLKTLRDIGRKLEVYVTESRPGREGLLLAEYAEILGYPVTLIVDSAARFFVRDVDKVVVGAEGIASNGALVAKVGTGLLSLVAKEARKRVFVIAPTMKFSYETIYGELLKLPEGGAELIVERGEEPPEGFTARVPLYEVAPPEYIDAIATEYGLIAPQAIPLLLRSIYGEYPPSYQSLPYLIQVLAEKYGVKK